MIKKQSCVVPYLDVRTGLALLDDRGRCSTEVRRLSVLRSWSVVIYFRVQCFPLLAQRLHCNCNVSGPDEDIYLCHAYLFFVTLLSVCSPNTKTARLDVMT